jgi:hypothetical protein
MNSAPICPAHWLNEGLIYGARGMLTYFRSHPPHSLATGYFGIHFGAPLMQCPPRPLVMLLLPLFIICMRRVQGRPSPQEP